MGKRASALLLVLLPLLLMICSSCASRPATTPQPGWHGIVPGVSTEEDVVRVLGEPTERREVGTYVIYHYPSPVAGMSNPDRIVFKGGRVRLIRDTVGDNNLKLVLIRYGEPEKVTWSPSSAISTRLFVFARQGVAFVAQNTVPPAQSPTVEQWYFEPMPLQELERGVGALFIPEGPSSEDRWPEDYWVREP